MMLMVRVLIGAAALGAGWFIARWIGPRAIPPTLNRPARLFAVAGVGAAFLVVMQAVFASFHFPEDLPSFLIAMAPIPVLGALMRRRYVSFDAKGSSTASE
ncbi:MAG TPA: hypothetical protein VG245_08845 [Candidatus Dormibacteraeota bacterium]|nr:hypothetical protein [Candidatus Dormibacteraeota bacterium]